MRPSDSSTKQGRRNFLKTGGALAAGLLAQPVLAEAKPAEAAAGAAIARDAMPTRNLGKTGRRRWSTRTTGTWRCRSSIGRWIWG